MRKTAALAIAALVMLTAIPTGANPPAAKDVLRADDGSAVVGTAVAAKDDLDTLIVEIRKEFAEIFKAAAEIKTDLAEIKTGFARIKAWGLAFAFLFMLTNPILTVLWMRKLGTPQSHPPAQR